MHGLKVYYDNITSPVELWSPSISEVYGSIDDSTIHQIPGLTKDNTFTFGFFNFVDFSKIVPELHTWGITSVFDITPTCSVDDYGICFSEGSGAVSNSPSSFKELNSVATEGDWPYVYDSTWRTTPTNAAYYSGLGFTRHTVRFNIFNFNTISGGLGDYGVLGLPPLIVAQNVVLGEYCWHGPAYAWGQWADDVSYYEVSGEFSSSKKLVVFNPQATVPGDGYGLRLYNNSSTLVYDSSDVYMLRLYSIDVIPLIKTFITNLGGFTTNTWYGLGISLDTISNSLGYPLPTNLYYTTLRGNSGRHAPYAFRLTGYKIDSYSNEYGHCYFDIRFGSTGELEFRIHSLLEWGVNSDNQDSTTDVAIWYVNNASGESVSVIDTPPEAGVTNSRILTKRFVYWQPSSLIDSTSWGRYLVLHLLAKSDGS